MKKFVSCYFLLILLIASVAAQPFSNDIAVFKKQDSISFPPKHAILFVGSSSFTNWKDVQNYFPSSPIINRGFGGSTLLDVIRFAQDVIYPYHAKQIVIYCGENDLASSDTVTAKMVLHRFQKLFNGIRKNNSAVPIAFVSLKPSPGRKHLRQKMEAANTYIKNYLASKKNTVFIDVYHAMFTIDGVIMNNIFLEDSLHMNAKGYAIWQKAIKPYLKK